MNFTEREDGEEYECGPDGRDEEEYESDEREAFVLRRMMLTPKCDEQTQCHQLFRTRCTVLGKIFGLIIDSGSCENIIGREVVKRLNLPVEKHPDPYSLGWIKTAAAQVHVTERCKVPFSIGKYRDEVYCDVVDMDVCQLLFGRPW